MATRELGTPTKADLKDIKELSEFLIMDSHDLSIIKEKLLEVWAMGHNQGYEDAYAEQENN